MFSVAVEPVLVQPQRGYDRLAVRLGAGGDRKRHPEQKRLLLAPFKAEPKGKCRFGGSVHGPAQPQPNAGKAAGDVDRTKFRGDHDYAVLIVAQADPSIVAG